MIRSTVLKCFVIQVATVLIFLFFLAAFVVCLTMVFLLSSYMRTFLKSVFGKVCCLITNSFINAEQQIKYKRHLLNTFSSKLQNCPIHYVPYGRKDYILHASNYSWSRFSGTLSHTRAYKIAQIHYLHFLTRKQTNTYVRRWKCHLWSWPFAPTLWISMWICSDWNSDVTRKGQNGAENLFVRCPNMYIVNVC